MTDFTLTAQRRLSDKKAITGVFNEPSCKAFSKFGVVLVRPNHLAYSRIVIIVGKKNIRKAVDRNRARRLVRESFRKLCSDIPDGAQRLACLNSIAGNDFVFIARKPLANARQLAPADLGTLWENLLRQLLRAARKNSEALAISGNLT